VIVVSDTGPLNYAIQIGCVEVLPALFKTVHLPRAVADELTHPKTPRAVLDWMAQPPAWLIISQAPDREHFPTLGRGESEAIALAVSLDADLLIDDLKGKRIATGMGLRTVGLLALMRIASERGLVDLLVALDRLEKTSFFVPRELLATVRLEEIRRRGG
jgi:predicted nucleic acid-binding protein